MMMRRSPRDGDDDNADQQQQHDDNNEQQLQAPLLLRPSLLQPRTPPRHAFQIRNPNRADEDAETNNNNEQSPITVNSNSENQSSFGAHHHRHSHRQDIALALLGRPYASTSTTQYDWWKSLLASALLGAGVAVTGLSFVSAVFFAREKAWMHTTGTSAATTTTSTPLLHQLHQWPWLAVTTAGGFVAGLILLLPSCRSSSSSNDSSYYSTLPLRHVATFQAATRGGGGGASVAALLLSSVVALATGAPLGPEVAVSALAVQLATLLANLCGSCRRTRALWISAALSAALGGFVYVSPLVGPLLVLELVVTTRPDKVTIDSLLLFRHFGTNNSNSNNNRNTSNGPTSTTTTAAAAAAAATTTHDYMEVLSLQVVATTVCVLVVRLFLNAVLDKNHYHTNNDNDDLYDYTFEWWHALAAVPLGVVCGCVGTAFTVLTLLFAGLRKCIIRRCSCFRRLGGGGGGGGAGRAVSMLFCSTMAGLLHGLLFVLLACPPLAMDWFFFLRHLTTTSSGHDDFLLSTQQLALTAVAKLVGTSLCLGLGGMVGGSVIPMVVVGACVGHVLSATLHDSNYYDNNLLPLSLVLPCCLAACPASILPAPLSAVVAVTLLVGTSAEQTTPVLVATLTAWTVTGGLGLLRQIILMDDGDDDDENSTTTSTDNAATGGGRGGVGGEEEGASPLSDDEILNNIHSAIFGGVSA